jgi:glutamine transport system substrate-binding protein
MGKKLVKKTLLSAVLISSLIISGCTSDETPKSDEKVEILSVGTDTSYVPFEFLDQKSGEYVGFDIDLMKAISEEAGFEYELKPMDFTGIIPALQTGNLDLAIAGITINPDREDAVDFSTPYYDAGTAILISKDEENIKSAEDLNGKVVATKQGTSSYDYAKEIEGIKNIVPFPNIDQAYMELEKGSADAVIFDLPNILYYMKTNQDKKVKVVDELLEGQSFGIAFPKGSDLRDDVDAALIKLKENGTYDELYEKWFGE